MIYAFTFKNNHILCVPRGCRSRKILNRQLIRPLRRPNWPSSFWPRTRRFQYSPPVPVGPLSAPLWWTCGGRPPKKSPWWQRKPEMWRTKQQPTWCHLHLKMKQLLDNFLPVKLKEKIKQQIYSVYHKYIYILILNYTLAFTLWIPSNNRRKSCF